MERIEDFFHAIDRACDFRGRPRSRLRVIGSAALMFQADYERGTTDSDIVETDLPDDVRDRLRSIAARGTPLARDHGMHLDLVNVAILLIPQPARWHRVEQLRDLRWFDVEMLDIVDVVVSKLKRFASKDREDITAMVQRGHVAHADLVARFRGALDQLMYGASGVDAVTWCENLNAVEREDLRVEPTVIDLPTCVGH
jgi:hypothetical protein